MSSNLLRRTALYAMVILLLFSGNLRAQTDIDALMMGKKNLCIGPMYGYSSWTEYWEGTFKRDNANLGKVSSSMFAVMGNYGVTSKLNVLFGLPYISNKASAGTLHQMKGLQDLSLWVKYMPIEKKMGPGTFSMYTIGGLSFPVSDYSPDYLPLSIGLHSTNLSGRLMFDYQFKHWFATVSGTYVYRNNIKLDRTSYYTTEIHYTDEVEMPNATQYNIRTGWRSDRFIAEAVLNNWTTQGGFDITKNNMPFPSNRMNMTTVGFNGKYNIQQVSGLSLTGGANFTTKGRNVGDATSYNFGAFYILDFSKKAAKKTDNKKS